MQSDYDNVLTNLKLRPDASFSEVYTQMITEIYEFYKTLNDKLLEKNNVA